MERICVYGTKPEVGLVPEKLNITINVSLTPEAIRMIKILCRLKIYVSQSELLRRAISDYLNRRVWGGVNPTYDGFYAREC